MGVPYYCPILVKFFLKGHQNQQLPQQNDILDLNWMKGIRNKYGERDTNVK
jgi:hypothetical protein